MRDLVNGIVVIMAAMALVACDNQQAAIQTPAAAADAPSAGSAGGPVAGVGASKKTTGKVVETMNSGGYTYVQVDDGAKKIWAAAQQFVVAVGDRVVVPDGVPMSNFHSNTLGRTFDMIYFVDRIQVVGGPTASEQVAAAHGPEAKKAGAAALDVSNIEKAEGGYTVAELFANKAAMAGKEVAVRGKVAKFTSGAMGKNWVHLQDGTGTGSAGTNDLAVTTSAVAAVGDTVLVRGKLGTDKDFGFGYKYDVIIEDAVVAVE